MSCGGTPRVYQDEPWLMPRCGVSSGACPCGSGYFRFRKRCCPLDQVSQPDPSVGAGTLADQLGAVQDALLTVTAAEFEASGVVSGMSIFDVPQIAQPITISEAGLTVNVILTSGKDATQTLLSVAADSPNQPTDLANAAAVITVVPDPDSPGAATPADGISPAGVIFA